MKHYRVLLDTNMWVYLLNNARDFHIQKSFRFFPAHNILLSSLVLAELQYGMENSTHKNENQQQLEILTQNFSILPFDAECAAHYGKIRAELPKGIRIGAMDLLIAAQAVAYNLVLVTNNMREFGRIQALRAENWLQ